MTKMAIMRAFDRAAPNYDSYAQFQRDVGFNLLDFASLNQTTSAKTVLDAGCGTGFFSRELSHRGFSVTALDFSSRMLQQAKLQQSAASYIQYDLEQLTELPNQFDIIFSNLALQWCSDFTSTIKILSQQAKCKIAFSTILAGSLSELNLCRQSVGNPFLTLAQILAACSEQKINWNVKSHGLSFESIYDLLASIKGVGANYQFNANHKGLTGKNYFNELTQRFNQQFGELRLTYQIFYGVIDCA